MGIHAYIKLPSGLSSATVCVLIHPMLRSVRRLFLLLLAFSQLTMKYVRTDANIPCSISRRIVIDMQGWIPNQSDRSMLWTSRTLV